MWTNAVMLKRLTFTIWTSFSRILLLSRSLPSKLDLAHIYLAVAGMHFDCIGPVKCGSL